MWEESNENPTTHKKVSQAAVLCVRNQIKNGPHIKGLTIDDNLGATLYWGCKPTQFRNIVANCKIVISKELSCDAKSPGIQLYVQYQRDWVMSMLLQIQCWVSAWLSDPSATDLSLVFSSSSSPSPPSSSSSFPFLPFFILLLLLLLGPVSDFYRT